MSNVANNFGGKQWTALESSPLYHMITWGYTNKEIADNLQSKFPTRTWKSINQQVSLIRKWVSYIQDFPVSNYNVSKKNEKMYNKASQFTPWIDIVKFKREKDFKPVTVFKFNKKTGEPAPILNAKKNEKPVKIVKTFAELGKALKPAKTLESLGYKQAEETNKNKSEQPTIIDKPIEVQVKLPTEFTAIDVMKMAKDLGAKEVEFQGIKIKF